MQITDIQVHLVDEKRLKAFISVTFDNCFVVHNMKIVVGEDRLFLCMPSRKTAAGEYRDLAHPITRSFRASLEEEVLKAYRNMCATKGNSTTSDSSLNGTQAVF